MHQCNLNFKDWLKKEEMTTTADVAVFSNRLPLRRNPKKEVKNLLQLKFGKDNI